jgi:hypothetical protein
VFKRRNPRNLRQKLVNLVIPGGGWGRSANYVMHRLRRLPDTPERIARGISAGVAVSCLPIFGLHFLSAAILALILRGNVLASLLATFFGNPFTFPLIAIGAMEIGSWLLGFETPAKASEAVAAFGAIWQELAANVLAVFTPEPFHWEKLSKFGWDVFAPYMLGGFIIALVCGPVSYFMSLPVIRAYHARRMARLRRRFEQARNAERTE